MLSRWYYNRIFFDQPRFVVDQFTHTFEHQKHKQTNEPTFYIQNILSLSIKTFLLNTNTIP